MQTSTARGLSATDDDEAKKFQRRQPDLPEEDDDVESRRKGVEGRRSTADRERDRQRVHAIKPSEGGRWSVGRNGRCAVGIMTTMNEKRERGKSTMYL